mgnify:CR=1 FL=1
MTPVIAASGVFAFVSGVALLESPIPSFRAWGHQLVPIGCGLLLAVGIYEVGAAL